MNLPRNIAAPPSRTTTVSTPLALLLVLLLVLTAGPAAAARQNTAFLPLRINAPGNVPQLKAQADKLLLDTLAARDFAPVSRSQAETLADYQGSWPPNPTTLQKIATTTGYDNVAVGSLTMVGKQVSIDMKVFDLLAPTKPKYFFRTANSLDDLQPAVEGVVLDVLAYTGRQFRIASIAPEGNKRIDSGAILRKIKSRAGGAYNPETLREDLKAIYSMGYFNNVQIDVTDSPEGKKVIFKVEEKPVINSITYSGITQLTTDDVKGAANIRAHYILNPRQVNKAVEAIKQLYKSKGYYDTKVKAKITFPTNKGADIDFAIDEGKKIYIKKISFKGNTTFDSDVLMDQIQTQEKGWFSWLTASGLLDMDQIKQDTGRIVAFYQNHGFLEAKVGEPEVQQKNEWLYLTFTIEEGPRFKVGTVKLSGELITDKQTLMNLLTIRHKKYMDRAQLRQDILAITDYYADKGYAFASVRPQMRKSASGDRIDINLKITKGELVYINRISIHGNTRTRDNVIRRELRITEGGIFNAKALRQSTQALQRLQYFEEVNVTPEPTMDQSRMNINIEVKERSTGNFSIGFGYSSVDNLILTGEIAENNFLGLGDKLSLSGNVGGSSSLYNLGFTNPHVNDSELSFGVDLFSTEREYDDYTKDATGGGIRIGYPVFEKWRLYGNYSYTDTRLTDVADTASYIIRNSVNLPVMSAIKLSLVRDTRNKLYEATSGSRHLVSVKYGGGPLGGDAQFTKLEGSTSWYFPLFLKTALHVKGAAGQVFENETDKLPVYERFYLGGISTVRGFKYGKISPIDPASGDRIGGDKMWYTNVELLFPIIEKQGIQGMIFFDSGKVMNDDEDWSVSSAKQAVGLGLHWLSPMGPINIVWGYNLDPLSDEDASVFDFSVGGVL